MTATAVLRFSAVVTVSNDVDRKGRKLGNSLLVEFLFLNALFGILIEVIGT